MKDKTFNTLMILLLINIGTCGILLTITSQNNKLAKALLILLENDEKTNKRITDVNRKLYKDYAMISKEDACKVVKTHIREKHTSNGAYCKSF